MMNIKPFSFFFMVGVKNFFVRYKTLLLIVTLHLFLFVVVHRCHVELWFCFFFVFFFLFFTWVKFIIKIMEFCLLT